MRILKYFPFLESHGQDEVSDDDLLRFYEKVAEFKSALLKLIKLHELVAHKATKLSLDTELNEKITEFIRKSLDTRHFDEVNFQLLLQEKEAEIYGKNKIVDELEQLDHQGLVSISFIQYYLDLTKSFQSVLRLIDKNKKPNQTTSEISDYLNELGLRDFSIGKIALTDKLNDLYLPKFQEQIDLVNSLTQNDIKFDEDIIAQRETRNQNYNAKIKDIIGKQVKDLLRQDKMTLVKMVKEGEIDYDIIEYLEEMQEMNLWAWQMPKIFNL